ncbi:MAG: hypothetical protein LBV39_00880, partial [Bacteroidales bacterium]|nr:hypothetical protein [Bacteroidales bacterium]
VLPLTKGELKNITKTNGWNFNWKEEFNNSVKDVYKLTIAQNPDIIQGLLSLSIERDHVFMHLLESAPFNIGKNKVYQGVAGNLVAYACKLSLQHGHEGNVGFIAKTKLIPHYEQTLGAVHIGGHRMIIHTPQAQILINKYFKM